MRSSAFLYHCALIAIASVVFSGEAVAETPNGWTADGGAWSTTRVVIPMIYQSESESERKGLARLLRDDLILDSDGVIRGSVKISGDTGEAGLCGISRDGDGLFLYLARGERSGFGLRTGDGTVLWDDKFAPCEPFCAYLMEVVVEGERIRVQLFESDGKTLLSQSPWMALPTPAARHIGFYTHDTKARFFGLERSDRPISPIVADAPNKRRLIASEKSPWSVAGDGSWMWATAKKKRLRQSSAVERTTAFNREIGGTHRKWECRIKVLPKTCGAGMLFAAAPGDVKSGFNAWLGGTFGDGALMLYQLGTPSKQLWSSANGKWQYDTEYVLRAETQKGKVRAQQLASDGETVLNDSGWISVDPKLTDHSGCLGLQTWRGPAEFSGFSEETRVAATGSSGPAKAVDSLGKGWRVVSGDWKWGDSAGSALIQTAVKGKAIVLCDELTAATGKWQCYVRPGKGAAGLIFQAGDDLKEGFVCLLRDGRVYAQSLDGRTLWESEKLQVESGKKYVLEGNVLVDRITVRLLSNDGTVLAACPDVYVSEKNNDRIGKLGLITEEGTAEFSGWQVTRSQ